MRKLALALVLSTAAHAALAAQAAAPSASDATAATPAAGTVAVYATINNPTMYDIYVQTGASEQAGKVELREGDTVVTTITVPSFGSVDLKAGGPFVLLSDLKAPAKAGDTVRVVLSTDGGVDIPITAVVK